MKVVDKMVGKVLEIFIPVSEKNLAEFQKLGFKIATIKQVFEFILPVNEDTSLIYKGDFVTITKDNDKMEIKPYIGEDYE